MARVATIPVTTVPEIRITLLILIYRPFLSLRPVQSDASLNEARPAFSASFSLKTERQQSSDFLAFIKPERHPDTLS
jgi:hypothetical protein